MYELKSFSIDRYIKSKAPFVQLLVVRVTYICSIQSTSKYSKWCVSVISHIYDAKWYKATKIVILYTHGGTWNRGIGTILLDPACPQVSMFCSLSSCISFFLNIIEYTKTYSWLNLSKGFIFSISAKHGIFYFLWMLCITGELSGKTKNLHSALICSISMDAFI